MNIKTSKNYKTKILLDDSLQTFYWIGFILADGSLNYENNNTNLRLSLRVAEKDENHLLKYSKYISVPIKTYKYFNKGTNYSKLGFNTVKSVRFMDNIILNELKNKFYIFDRKTYNPPDINKWNFTTSQLISLIIGYIDGDGYIYKSLRQYESYKIGFKVHKSWILFLDYILINLNEIYDVKSKVKAKYVSNTMCKLVIGNRKIIYGLKKFIIDNNLDVLERKWNKINYTGE